MKTSNKGLNLLKEFEGVVPYEYLCSANKPTISKGIRTDLLSKDDLDLTFLEDSNKVKPIYLGGNLIEPNIVNGKVRCITNENSDLLIAKTIVKFEKCINDTVTRELKQHEFDSLVSLVYNIGITAFKRSSVLKQVNQSYIPRGFLLYNRAGGKFSQGLADRRAKEYNLYCKGLY